MVKTLLFIIILFNAQLLFSGELSITPEKQSAGGVVTVSYTDESRFTNYTMISCYYYVFTENQTFPFASEFELLRDNSVFKGSLTIPDDAVYIIIKVGREQKFDNNNGVFWDLIIWENGDRPKKNAYFRKGLSKMGTLPDNCSPLPNLIEARELMEIETKYYPDNIPALIATVSIRMDLRTLTRDEFSEEIEKIIEKDFDKNNENYVRAKSRALKAINETEEAEALEREFAKENPRSNLAEEVFLTNLSKSASVNAFIDGAEIFLKQYPQSHKRADIFSSLLNAILSSDRIAYAEKMIENFDNVPAQVLIRLAYYYMENQKVTDKAFELLNQAIELTKENKSDIKPQYLTNSEWEHSKRIILADLYQAKAELLFFAERKDEDIENFLISKEFYGDNASETLYENLAIAYYKYRQDEQSFAIAEEAIAKSAASPRLYQLHERLFTILKKSGRYAEHLAVLNQQAKTLRQEKLKSQKMNLQIDLGSLENLEGLIIDLSIYKGKVLVLDFWSTWCEPCEDLFKVLPKQIAIYQNEPDVKFLPINIWELTDNRKEEAGKILNEMKLNIPLYFDERDRLPALLGVFGLPIRFYIDKNGLVQFKEVGILQEREAIIEANDKIEVLLAE